MSFSKGVRAVEIELLKCDACQKEIDAAREDFTGWVSMVTMEKKPGPPPDPFTQMLVAATAPPPRRGHACKECAAEIEAYIKELIASKAEGANGPH
jgi:hypothetical protein